MTPIKECLENNNTTKKPIWLMRQAGRYLPEFRNIRKKNTDFIKLCLNENLASEITLQPLKRFDLDAAIIFSDILIVPYGLNQNLKFEKNFGPRLEKFNLNEMYDLNENDFIKKIESVYKAINIVSKDRLTANKSTIGFVGAPWTLLVYMINRQSPKLKLVDNFFSDPLLIEKILTILDKFLKVHIKKQIESGAQVIQIFDSWAGLLKEKDYDKFIYNPTSSIVEYVNSLKVPVICFPKGIKNYKEYCETIKPDVICIDYETDPMQIQKEIKIPVQGGMDPKILLSDKDNLQKEAKKYLEIFKDHPYIFNLGHGVLPDTDPNMVDYLVKTVKDF